MTIITRFAPSPTGMLHIGSARTALFNYLFAKKHNGKFLLRIEDTDIERSTEESKQAILDGLSWLEIKHDEEIVLQSNNYEKHIEAAKKMIENGTAYYAYDTEEELKIKREEAEKNGSIYQYNGSKWYNISADQIPNNVKPVIRLKVPKGKTIVNDLIRGVVEFDNSTLDDLVLIRSNGIPTYMLAVVVDDINMNITHVIRGEDHLSNTPKQILIYQALNAKVPQFAHLPMIHDIEGKKLSKRRGSVATAEYQKEGYLPDAICNYLLHLGWNDGTEKEFYSRQEAIEFFSIERCGKSPSRFDFEKLKNINLYYIKNLKDADLIEYLKPFIEDKIHNNINNDILEKLNKILPELKKMNLLTEMRDNFITLLDDKSFILSDDDLSFLEQQKHLLDFFVNYVNENINNDYLQKESFELFLKERNIKLSEIAPVIRLILIGKKHSFGLYKIFEILSTKDIHTRILNYKTTNITS